MAQEFTPILENDIGALAPDRTPAKVRAIDDQGRSINLTPTQLAAMAGFDYSIEAEQKVPGEKWPDRYGVVRQVFTRTIRARIPTTPWVVDPAYYNVVLGIKALQWNVVTAQFVGKNDWTSSPTINCDGVGSLSMLLPTSSYASDSPYMVIIKYTKR